MEKRRLTYIARFWNAKPIRVSATCAAQAEKIARGVAAKENWVYQSVGVVPWNGY